MIVRRRMHCVDGKNAKCDDCEYSTYSPWRLKLHKQNKHNKVLNKTVYLRSAYLLPIEECAIQIHNVTDYTN